jgi:threonine synthase
MPSFSVPTGNFGDIFAGYAAARMGLPIGKLVIATNENDILTRTLEGGRYEPRRVTPTDSPSMDIQISSNFERLLFEASGRNGSFVTRAMAGLHGGGAFDVPSAVLGPIREQFSAYRVSGEEAAAAMRRLFEDTGIIIDPHTGVGLAAAQKERAQRAGPMVVLSTAHPAKFPEAVKRATGRTPEVPASLGKHLEGRERFKILPNSPSAVADYIDLHASAGATRHL